MRPHAMNALQCKSGANFGHGVIKSYPVAALSHPLSITCTGALVAYDTGYGIGQLAASPFCTVTVLATGKMPS